MSKYIDRKTNPDLVDFTRTVFVFLPQRYIERDLRDWRDIVVPVSPKSGLIARVKSGSTLPIEKMNHKSNGVKIWTPRTVEGVCLRFPPIHEHCVCHYTDISACRFRATSNTLASADENV